MPFLGGRFLSWSRESDTSASSPSWTCDLREALMLSTWQRINDEYMDRDSKSEYSEMCTKERILK